MATLLTPATLRRGFLIFVGFSVFAVAALVWSDDAAGFIPSLKLIQWPWVLVGVGLASLDWIGGGFRLWLLARVVHPKPSLKGCIIAGGMGAWGSYVTPLQAGASPMMIYTLRRYGISLPRAMTTTLMSFIATVVFFGLAGPFALLMGAGQALGSQGNLLGLSLLDLFKGTMGIFALLAVLLLLVMIAPSYISTGVHWLAGFLGARSRLIGHRLQELRNGIDQAHESMVHFNTPKGWLALLGAVLVSGPSHGNKLLAGYVALRAIGVEAHFVDVLLLQTLITFLLYFAPTPGASGIAEILAASIMANYLPVSMTTIYTLIWRCILSWYTIAAGFIVFSAWVRAGLRQVEVLHPEQVPP